MHPVTVFYLSLCVLTAWIVRRPAEGRGDVWIALGALTTGCVLSNVAWFRAALGQWIRIDAGVMLICLWLLARRIEPWRIILATLSVLTMGIHALVERLGDRSETILYVYPAALNAVFVLQLLCVASNGARGARDHGSDGVVSSWSRNSRRDLGNIS